MKSLKKKVFVLAVLFAGAACTCLIAMNSGTNYWNDDRIDARCFEKYSPGCEYSPTQYCYFTIRNGSSGPSRSADIKCIFYDSDFTGQNPNPGGGPQ